MIKAKKRQELVVNEIISEEEYSISINSLVSFVKTADTYRLRRDFLIEILIRVFRGKQRHAVPTAVNGAEAGTTTTPTTWSVLIGTTT